MAVWGGLTNSCEKKREVKSKGEKERYTHLNAEFQRIARRYKKAWRRQWHPTPVLLPGKSHGWRSLVGCSPWGRKESDMTERLHFTSVIISKLEMI